MSPESATQPAEMEPTLLDTEPVNESSELLEQKVEHRGVTELAPRASRSRGQSDTTRSTCFAALRF